MRSLINGVACRVDETTIDPVSSPSWRMVYANDAQGAAVAGSKDALVEAVRAGSPVRVYFGGGRVEHVADVQFLTIFDGEVFAQLTPIEGPAPGARSLAH